MIATEIYIEPISQDNPVGDNIEYDEQYQKLVNLLQEKPEQQFGDLIIEAQGQDWEAIYNLASDILLEKSKDLTVMSYFTQSAIYCYGLSGLLNGLEIIYQNLNMYWDDVFPQLYDEDQDYDPDYRINALSIFNANDGVIKAIRNAFFIKNGLSQENFTIKDIEHVLENSNTSHEIYPGGIERLSLDLQIASDVANSEINCLVKSIVLIEQIKHLFIKRISDTEIKFDTLEKFLLKFKSLIQQSEIINPIQVDMVTKSESITAVQSSLNWANYSISTRQDVELLLEKIHVYFEKNEPSHPAPLFIRRIQRLMNYNFYEIMRDISPDSLDRLETLVGQPFDNNSNDYD
ncbi:MULTISPECIES: type VI secretion system protein TssA [Acinetobacter]|uniref:Type VI secretion system protein TssA n=1 Tax=Acinetobacter piscicola TaxID=2006115 RepID=A0A7S6VY44_9GAMM|nr:MULTISPECIES: type VI secretion system protein TssA [Acinetobacter]QOW47021.1 type VI secretion system protein TssA [Acinetobacter piscicola]